MLQHEHFPIGAEWTEVIYWWGRAAANYVNEVYLGLPTRMLLGLVQPGLSLCDITEHAHLQATTNPDVHRLT